jgi:hypothetical protein
MGAKPSGLSQELDSPSAWGTLSAIASKMEKMAGSLSDHRVKELSLQAATEIKRKLLNKNSALGEKVDDITESLIVSTKILKNALAADAVRIDHLENNRDRLAALTTAGATASTNSTTASTNSGTKQPPNWAEDTSDLS